MEKSIQQCLEELEVGLRGAGLPSVVSQVEGKRFIFIWEDQDHRVIITGRVTSIAVSDSDGLELGVTSRYLQHRVIRSLIYAYDGWAIRAYEEDPPGVREFFGKFELLDRV